METQLTKIRRHMAIQGCDAQQAREEMTASDAEENAPRESRGDGRNRRSVYASRGETVGRHNFFWAC
jgi:hypothetical protein